MRVDDVAGNIRQALPLWQWPYSARGRSAGGSGAGAAARVGPPHAFRRAVGTAVARRRGSIAAARALVRTGTDGEGRAASAGEGVNG